MFESNWNSIKADSSSCTANRSFQKKKKMAAHQAAKLRVILCFTRWVNSLTFLRLLCEALPGISNIDYVVWKQLSFQRCPRRFDDGTLECQNQCPLKMKKKKKRPDIFCLSSPNTEIDPLIIPSLQIMNRLRAGVALSYLSLNTYQNQLDRHNNSKQVIFLMVDVIDAWQWVS